MIFTPIVCRLAANRSKRSKTTSFPSFSSVNSDPGLPAKLAVVLVETPQRAGQIYYASPAWTDDKSPQFPLRVWCRKRRQFRMGG